MDATAAATPVAKADARLRLRRWSWLAENVAVLVFFALATVWLTWPLTSHVRTHTADVGVDDPLLYARLLRHFLAWISGSHDKLFDADYFWPQPKVLATTDASLGILYCALPFLIFTRDLLTLVNLGVLLTFVLTGHATWLVGRELTQSRSAALFAGAAFAFCLFRLHQLDHLNILQMQWMGYALFGLLRLYAKPTRWGAAATAVALFLHGSAGTNVALYSTFLFAAVALWMVLSVELRDRKAFVVHLGAALAVAIVALIPIYGPYLELRAAHTLEWPEWHVDVYGGRAEQLFAAPAYNRVHGPAMVKNLFRESYLFLGWSVLSFAAIGVLLLRLRVSARRRPWAARDFAIAAADTAVIVAAIPFALKDRRIAVALILFVVGRELVRLIRKQPYEPFASFGLLLAGMALFYLFAGQGPHIQTHGQVIGEGLWRWLAKLPGFGAVRTPARFFFVVSLVAALVGAMGLAEVQRFFKKKWMGQVLALAAVAAVLFEMSVNPLPLRAMRRIESAHPAYKWVAQQPGKGAVLELPFYDPLERYRMYHTTVFDRPTVAGEAGWRPPVANWLVHDAFMGGGALDKLKLMRGSGVEFVLLDRRLLGGAIARYEQFVSESGASRVAELAGIAVWRYPPVKPKPLTRDFANAAVVFPAQVAPNAPVKVTAVFSATTPQPVFEFDTRKFSLEVETSGATATNAIYLSPPLMVAGVKQELAVDVALELREGSHDVRYELKDERGAVWAEGTARVRVR